MARFKAGSVPRESDGSAREPLLPPESTGSAIASSREPSSPVLGVPPVLSSDFPSNNATADATGHTSAPVAPRILDRDAAFHQSRGRWSVQRLGRAAAHLRYTPTGIATRVPLSKIIWDDWFHTLAAQRTVVLMLILFMVYAMTIFVFAFIYLGVSILGRESTINPDGSVSHEASCHMSLDDHMEALYFSLSTMASIGYGVSDYYFGGCWTPLLLVLAQVCCALTFDAVAIGLLFQRISRGHKRAKTVLFSDKAIVRRVQGVPYLMFRIAELRSHQLIEATVRGYCIRHERHVVASVDGIAPPTVETTHYVTRTLNFLHQEAGSHILMSLPQVLVHRMDETSPLRHGHAGSVWYDASRRTRGQGEAPQSTSPNDLMSQYKKDSVDTARFLQDRQAELVILVEGTDDLTGSAIQTRHSYTYQDLAWDEMFVPCVKPYANDSQTNASLPQGRRWCRPEPPTPACVVDFALFHETKAAPIDSESCPHIHW